MKIQRRQRPIALTVGGSDSGGGAGIQADLKMFTALGVHGTTAVTCITAQNPTGVFGVQAVRPQLLEQQLSAIFDELPPAAAKTGMLYSAPLIRVVSRFWTQYPNVPLVVDPVMVATSGAVLLQPAAIRALQDQLLPRATLLTPNLDEAALLVGRPLRTPEDLRLAARELHARFGCAVLVKGGHLRGMIEAMDIFHDGSQEWLLLAPFVQGVSTHGTGCTYAAAITARIAMGDSLAVAVRRAKQAVTGAIARSYRIGRGHMALCP